MSTAELELLPREGEAAAPVPRTAVAAAAEAALDLTKINLTDVALAQFGNWREQTAKVKADFEALVLDLSTQSAIDDAISLRQRKVKAPLAEARKVAPALKTKLAAVSKAIGAELVLVEAGWAEADAAITPRIDAAQRVLDDKKEADRLAEQQRLQGLRDKVDEILGQWVDHCKIEGITGERIGNGIAALRDIDPPKDLADVHAYWDTRKAQTVAAMQGLQLEAQRLENEREAQRLAAESAALAQQRQELEAAQARAAATPAAAAGADPTDTGAGKAENPAQQREATPESLADRIVRLAKRMSFHEAAEGRAYYEEAAAREQCRAEFNAAVQQAREEGIQVDLGGYLVPASTINALKPTQPTGLAVEACRPATAKETAQAGTQDPAAAAQTVKGAGDDATHAGDLRGPADTISLNLADLDEPPAADGSIETSEAEAVNPPAAVVEQVLQQYPLDGKATLVLTSPLAMQTRLDEAHALLRAALSLTERLGVAFKSKYPTQPKMGPDWWAALRADLDALQPRLIMALAAAKAE